MPFELANKYSSAHIIVQPSDARLNPPESYLYIQDGLIISCGVLYVLCYFFYITRTVKDKVCAGNIEYLGLTMAYEIYYSFVCTSTTFEFICFLFWFLFDVSFATVAVMNAYPTHGPHRRLIVTARIVGLVAAGVAFLHMLCKLYPDDREQITAYWTGALLETPIGWGSLYLLIKRGDTKGQSLEIWATRFLGCWTAFGVFIWRYLNIPENWSYVGSTWSIAVIVLTLLPEHIYPFVFYWVWQTEKTRAAFGVSKRSS